ncbi:MAG: hypothetical protein AAF721_20740 [Myxococcota bacterium]
MVFKPRVGKVVIACALLVSSPGCRSTTQAAPPTESSDNPPPAVPPFDPATVSDAPLTAQECAEFGALRASDPQETRGAEAYAEECVATTAREPAWMRRTTRCLIVAPTKEDRLGCFTDDLRLEKEASEARLEAQIEAERIRAEQERLEEAERILREARAAEGDPPPE